MEKLKQARQALLRFGEILEVPFSDLVRDATMQRFEFTFEATSAAIQEWLKVRHGREVRSPKAAARELFSVGDCTEFQSTQFLQLTDFRNKTVHTYNENLANEVYERRRELHSSLAELLDCLKI
jgi:nucleotidyltransferase substrate binding protein (TIGR01987 family)